MIRTERLHLRPVQDADAEDLYEVFSHPDAMRYWSHLPHETLDRTKALVEGMKDSMRESGAEFVIEMDGKVIGKAGLWRIAEIAYILRPDCWRQGIATEALEAIIPYCFDLHPWLNEITADIDPENEASYGLLESLGFHESGRAENTLKIGDQWLGTVYYTLDRKTWEARQKG